MPRILLILLASLICLTPASAKPSLLQRGFAVTRDVVFLIQPTEVAKLALFDERGKWITSVGTEEPNQPDSIIAPVELVTDSGGLCYVLDQFGPSVIVVGHDGKVLRRWGARGDEPGQMRQPIDFGLDSHNILWVLDPGRKAIIKFDTSGRFLSEVLLGTDSLRDLAWSNCIAVGPEGDFAVIADQPEGDILRNVRFFDAFGVAGAQWTLGKIAESGEIQDALLRADGSLLFADTQAAAGGAYRGAIYRFTGSGDYDQRWMLEEPRTGRSFTPVRIKQLGGVLYVLTQTNVVCRLDETGAIVQTWGAGEL
ncbi:MAG: 6-bladed beta-propeller [bacterium]